MKVFVIGDVHISMRNLPKIEIMFDELLGTSDKKGKFDLLKEKKKWVPDMIVLLGDTLDNHEKVHLSLLHRAFNFFDRLSKISKVYVLIGNHDRISNTDFMSDIHPFMRYSNPNVTIISKATREGNIAFIPYVPNGRFKEACDTIDMKDVKCVFCHQEFKGSNMGTIISTSGDPLPESSFITKEVDIEHKYLPTGIKFYQPVYISGHIHKFHILDNVIYPGTPYQVSSGEDTNKGYMLFELKDDHYTFSRITSGVPLRKITHMTYQEFLEKGTPKDNDQEKIIVSGTSEQLSQINGVTKKFIRQNKELDEIPSFIDILKSKVDNKYHYLLSKLL